MTFIFVPGQAGIKCNKRADSLSSSVPVIEDREWIALIFSMLLGIPVKMSIQTGSCTVTRLIELGVKRNVARNESYA